MCLLYVFQLYENCMLVLSRQQVGQPDQVMPDGMSLALYASTVSRYENRFA